MGILFFFSFCLSFFCTIFINSTIKNQTKHSQKIPDDCSTFSFGLYFKADNVRNIINSTFESYIIRSIQYSLSLHLFKDKDIFFSSYVARLAVLQNELLCNNLPYNNIMWKFAFSVNLSFF